MKKPRILLVSTAHPATDPRIVFKQCPTLAGQYDVTCALPHADASVCPEIRFWRLPYFRRVWCRVLLVSPLVLVRALWLRPAVVQIFVPELIPVALIFRLFGMQVIYEVQENLYRKMHLKTLNRDFVLAWAFYRFDQLARRYFYLIFTEHGYLNTYTGLAKPATVIYNYPLLPFLRPFQQTYQPDKASPSFLLIGLLSEARAFDTLIGAFAQIKPDYPDFVVHLFGRRTFTDDWTQCLPGFADVKENLQFYGYTDQRVALTYADHATAGLALLKPVGDYTESYPTKLFEYMALGLPVITSDFPLYRDVVDQHRCGLCVSPEDPVAVAHAMRYLIENPVEAVEMGRQGQRTVELMYNWTTEAAKLIVLYGRLLAK